MTGKIQVVTAVAGTQVCHPSGGMKQGDREGQGPQRHAFPGARSGARRFPSPRTRFVFGEVGVRDNASGCTR